MHHSHWTHISYINTKGMHDSFWVGTCIFHLMRLALTFYRTSNFSYRKSFYDCKTISLWDFSLFILAIPPGETEMTLKSHPAYFCTTLKGLWPWGEVISIPVKCCKGTEYKPLVLRHRPLQTSRNLWIWHFPENRSHIALVSKQTRGALNFWECN